MTDQKQRQPICFIFNSPVLIPWIVVKDVLEDQDALREAILSWDETKRDGYRFRENQDVADVNYPQQKMTVRRILREVLKDKDTQEKKTRMIGIECYWWVDITVDSIMKVLNNGSFNKKSSDISPVKEVK
jgi:hypothetical protein